MAIDILSIRGPQVHIYTAGLAVLLLLADYLAGPFIQFPVTYLIPVAIVAWSNGWRWALVYALVLPAVRYYFVVGLWDVPWTVIDASVNFLIRVVVLASFGYIIDRTAAQSRQLAREVDMLEGLLPICSFCKKIRDDRDEWQVLEKYIMDRSDATFSHGVCPECFRKHYGDVLPKPKT